MASSAASRASICSGVYRFLSISFSSGVYAGRYCFTNLSSFSGSLVTPIFSAVMFLNLDLLRDDLLEELWKRRAGKTAGAAVVEVLVHLDRTLRAGRTAFMAAIGSLAPVQGRLHEGFVDCRRRGARGGGCDRVRWPSVVDLGAARQAGR